MGYSATSIAVPLLFSTTSMVFNLAWSATSLLLTTSSPSRRSRTSSTFSKQKETTPYRTPPPSAPPSAQMELRLSTSCSSCGSKVSLEVPKWISDSVDAANNGKVSDGSCQNGKNGGPTAGEIRGVVVEGAVTLAHAVKASPVRLHTLAAPYLGKLTNWEEYRSSPSSTPPSKHFSHS